MLQPVCTAYSWHATPGWIPTGHFDWLFQQQLVDFLETERPPIVLRVGEDLKLLASSDI